MKKIVASISLLTVLLGCSVIKSSPRGQTVNPRGLPIIDMHMHATPLEAFPPEWGRPPRNPVTGMPSAATNNEAIMTASLRAMAQFNIVKAVVSGPLDVVHQWQAAAPGRIIGGIWGAPGDAFLELANRAPGVVFPDIETLRKEFESGRVAVLGELLLPYVGLTPNDPKLEPYFALAERFDIPVAIHTGAGPPRAPYEGAPLSRVGLGNPFRKFVGGTTERCSLDLSPETRLLHDLGLDADDAGEFLEAFAREFSVDLNGFPFRRYFGTEVDAGIRWCSRKLLGDRGVGKAPLTLQQLVVAARAGKWEAQS